MAANLPEITYRYPTLANGPQSAVRPSIIFDWSTDMETSQFSDDGLRATKISLIDEETSTIIGTDYVSYTTAQKRVTLQPSQNLESNKSYRLLIRSQLQSTDGRKSRNEYHWTFTTASGSINETTLLSPGDATVQAISPLLQWSAVTYVSSSSSIVNYLVYLSTRYDFGTIAASTTTLATSALFDLSSISDETTYYWKILPYTVGATGYWSDVWSFYYGRPLDADPTTRQYLPDADTFGVDKLAFKNGASHLAAYPTLSIYFFSSPATSYGSYVSVWKKSVYPRNDDETTYFESEVGGSWAVSGAVLTFTPSETIANNTRYEIRLEKEMPNTQGYLLGEDYSFWFVSKYAPFYASARSVRARFLGAEQKVPDDLINFYIHQASLEANARYWGYGDIMPSVGDSLSEDTVRDSAKLTSYGVLKWVEAAAAYKILKAILFEHIRDIGRTERLGDSLVSLTKDFVTGLDKALELVKEELDQWDNYLAPSDVPVTISKSSGWTPMAWDYDWSIMDLESKRDDCI